MILSSWAAFSGSNEFAAMDGDEIQSTLRALREAGVHIFSLHNHMIGEGPTFYFTHFWAKGAGIRNFNP